jgi:hypothetical protein
MVMDVMFRILRTTALFMTRNKAIKVPHIERGASRSAPCDDPNTAASSFLE